MVRSKMPMKLIDGEKRRNMTFMKRRVGIKKKARELATLCDIPILLVCFGPEGQVETWPENQHEVCDIINKYRSLSSEDRNKRKFDLSSFFKDQIRKLMVELDRMCKSGGNALYASHNHQLNDMSEESLQEFVRSLDTKLKDINERIQMLRGQESMKGKECFEGWQHAEINSLNYLLDMHQGDVTLDSILSHNPKQGSNETSDTNGLNGVALWQDGGGNNLHHSSNTYGENGNESLEGDKLAICEDSSQNELQFLSDNGNKIAAVDNVPIFAVPYIMPYDHRNMAMSYYGASVVYNNAQLGYYNMQQYASGSICSSFDPMASSTSLDPYMSFGYANNINNVHMHPPECSSFHNSRFNMLGDHILSGSGGSSNSNIGSNDNNGNNGSNDRNINKNMGVSYNMMYNPINNNRMYENELLHGGHMEREITNSLSSSILCTTSSGAIAAMPVVVSSGGTPYTTFGSNPHPHMKP